MFKDRLDAARQLALALKKYRGQNPLVLAIPRGAVPMTAWIADALNGQMDVVLVRKLRAPSQPEVAIGAVDETGLAYLSPCATTWGLDPQYVKDEIKRQMKTLKSRRGQYSQIRPPIPVQGRVVIVVDDGLATGATMMSALKALRQHHPQRLVCAIPVASPDALANIKPLADETVCLSAPEDFMAWCWRCYKRNSLRRRLSSSVTFKDVKSSTCLATRVCCTEASRCDNNSPINGLETKKAKALTRWFKTAS
jgi:predicted phosphoribosyltransferase